jgi:hypothetical protein
LSSKISIVAFIIILVFYITVLRVAAAAAQGRRRAHNSLLLDEEGCVFRCGIVHRKYQEERLTDQVTSNCRPLPR